uniref:Alpha-amylase n=1 Tax=Candidatus Kentrum sp. LPFa TaxID=2126335 RepID=A0A450WRY1_9GAMM|nr:MAG: Glycosidase [Candidatus Kentron sp. LPFa]
MAQLQELVHQAHARQIAIVLDVVVNHIANLLDWVDVGNNKSKASFKYLNGDPDSVLPLPEEACNTGLFHGLEYTDMINQRLFGFLEDWATETDYVRELLVAHLKYWLSVTNVDGFRFDAARHVGVDFWQPALEELGNYANVLGKQDFLLLAEHAGYTHAELVEYSECEFSAFIDYPTYYQLKESVAEDRWLRGFADYFCGHLATGQRYGDTWHHNVVFIDNQDTTRLLHEFLSRQHDRKLARACLHFALVCLLLGPQRPALYAGTEQEFCGALGVHQDPKTGAWIGHDCHVREDLFSNPECRWKFGPINQPIYPPYCREQPTYRLVQSLAALRRNNPAFACGSRSMLSTRNHGLCAVLVNNEYGQPPFLVLLNIGNSHITEEVASLPIFANTAHVEAAVAAPNAHIHCQEQRFSVQLPPFAYIVLRLSLSERTPSC